MKKLDTVHIETVKRGYDDKLFALAPAMDGGYWIAGVVVAGEKGYHPLPKCWCNIEQGPNAYTEFSDHLDALNLEHFGHTTDTAAKIILSSLR